MSSSVPTHNKLPFSIDEKSFSKWMADLDIENKTETLKTILSTLQMLTQTVIQPEIRFFFIQKLLPFVGDLSLQLQTTYIKSHFPFSREDKLKIELSASCAIELAKNHALLCENPGFMAGDVFTQQQKTLIIFSGIQVQANALLYKSILYEKPGKGFWHLCFMFYLFAKRNDDLENGVDCFINTFKQILIFELSNTQQFNTEEIITIFSLLNKISNQVDLLTEVPEKKFKGIPFINLREDSPPCLPKQEKQQENPYLYYIFTLNVIKHLFELSTVKETSGNCTKVTLLRLIKSLTMNQQRKSERELADGELYAIVGFEKIKAYLLDIKKTESAKNSFAPGQIRDLNFEIQQGADNHSITDDYRSEREANMTIATHFEAIEHVESTDIWERTKAKPKQKKDLKKPIFNAEFIDKSMSGYQLCLKEKEVEVEVGAVIALMISETLVITVIRRIIKAQQDEILVGVEVLGRVIELLQLVNTENIGAESALYLKAGEETESILIKADEFQNEIYFYADKGDAIVRFKVEKQRHASSLIKHLEVSLS